MKQRLFSAFVGAALVAALAAAFPVPASAQSRLMDETAPVRFDLDDLSVRWPRDAAGFWRSNSVVRGVSGSAALSAGVVTVTNAAVLSTDYVLATWASTGKVGAIIATVGSGTVTLRSTSTNDQTGTINWLAIRQ